MPRIPIPGRYRFSFVNFDLSEPVHVHIREGNRGAKLWIENMSFAWTDFKDHENAEILRIAQNYRNLIYEKWHEYEDRLQ
jgi:hypothetical protein